MESWLRIYRALSIGAACLPILTALAAAPPAGQAAENHPGEKKAYQTADVDQVARDLSNPLTSFWSLNNEIDFQYWNGGADDRELQTLWNIKPVIPFDLGNGWMCVNRLTFPIVLDQPYFDRHSYQWEDDSGFGDIQYLGVTGVNFPGGGVLAAGLTAIFPTASNDNVGAGKYQAGPALAAAILDKKYIVGALFQHWWSYAGDEDFENVNYSALQIFYFLNFPGGWQVGGSPVITANWMAEDDDNRFNVPLGIGVFKTMRLGKLPVKVGIEYQYSVVQEDLWGHEQLIKVVITPVIPALF